LSATAITAERSRVTPEGKARAGAWATSRILVGSTLCLILLAGFGLRASQLSAEGLSEDELNKLNTVADYRAHGLTSTNGEHPFLMKALLTLSIMAAEKWNSSNVGVHHPDLRIAEETALRLPGVLLGTFTALLLYLIVAELFGPTTALVAAALWALDPAAVGFNRIAKEDTFLLFFFLLANVFWLRCQRAAETGQPHPLRYAWATAAAFGAMLASKYMPHLIAISTSYYHIFQQMPATRWRLGKRRWLKFFALMGVVFVLCNPTILLPGTWHEMRIFAGEHRIGHTGYEFMGRLYRNQMTLWLRGIPWYFYYAFMAFKLPLTVVAGFLVGLPLLFTRRLGDARYFVLFYLYYWFFPFTFLGGKFLRYFTVALPVVHITTAVGLMALAAWLARLMRRAGLRETLGGYVRFGFILCALAGSAYASARALPHYRLYTNALGGGQARAGDYFPHDEFYDSGVRDTAATVARLARPHARVASETPELFTHYAHWAGRDDLIAVSLSDRAARAMLAPGDIIIVARGRRYYTNDALIKLLASVRTPTARVSVGATPAVNIYVLDEATLRALAAINEP
jgi:predicted membrane-bound dolichyl-phosphate-mannose-protein mannosyltransferase